MIGQGFQAGKNTVGGLEVLRGQGGGYGKTGQAGRLGGLNPGRGIFDHQAAFRFLLEIFQRLKVQDRDSV